MTAVARQVLPVAAPAAGALVASLAAERALARLVTVALGRAGRTLAAAPFGVVAPGLSRPRVLERYVVTETTIVERISRRS